MRISGTVPLTSIEEESRKISLGAGRADDWIYQPEKTFTKLENGLSVTPSTYWNSLLQALEK
jgi:hypothetical protein